MPYSLVIQHKKNGNYYVYKSSFRENGKVRSKYVYLGNEGAALKILADFNSKKPANERLLSLSGEEILAKVLEMLDFKNIISKAIQRDTKLDAGRFVEMIVVERALKSFSKWGLAAIAHGKSAFSLDPSIPMGKFTEANIYHYMDYLHPHLDAIQELLVENLLRVSGLELSELIIDGTSVSCFGDDETAGDDGEEEDSDGGAARARAPGDPGKYQQVKRVHGYSRAKRPDLAQVNLMLGVNGQSIPFFFQTFPGNAPDVFMFQSTLEKCQDHYSSLLTQIRSRYIVFDKGNNNPGNIKALDALCRKWQFHFVASIRPSMAVVRKELLALAAGDAPVIYTQKKTVLRGKTVSLPLYGAQRNVMLYINEEIMAQKRAAFQEKVKQLTAEIRGLLEQDGPARDKAGKVESLLRKRGLLSCFTVQVKKNAVTCTPVKEKLDAKQNALGKYALMTDDVNLDAASILRIYKATGVIEQEFHHLKSDLAISPIFHRKPDRIQVHFALILWGMMALALLRCLLKEHSLDFTFEALRAKIQEGVVSIGDYIYPGGKSYRIRKSLNIGKELKAIFQVLKIKWEYFEINQISHYE